ncbi:CorA family divalent cation transporter [Methylobacterium durans]|uniref:CorA family divalent cation transporter n=1 Tax=Methylobacterium durans TaxID=2202825 RepID=UPI002AFE39AD|nr:CorA family divalent cation transporter [Methylobacterium durans]MEA1834788.1 CorA family divalent cation transporter [Methylobacterium durans]
MTFDATGYGRLLAPDEARSDLDAFGSGFRRCCCRRRWSATWSRPWRQPVSVSRRRWTGSRTACSTGARDERRRLGPIRRSAVRLHRQLLGLAAVSHRLEEDDAARDLHGPAVAVAARLAQRLDALDRDVTALAERACLLQEEVGARVAEESNRQLYVRSILSALFLPPTFITGLFGTNVKELPFADEPWGFLFVVGLSLVSAAATFGIIRAIGIRPPRG